MDSRISLYPSAELLQRIKDAAKKEFRSINKYIIHKVQKNFDEEDKCKEEEYKKE